MTITWGANLVTSFPTGKPEFDSILKAAETAEKLGFHSVWVGDHVLWHVPILEPLVVLSALATRTTSIKLGTSVLLVPLRNPVLLAKMVATLDFVSNGRLILGVGVGGEYKKEFDAIDVPTSQRGRRTDESLEIMKRLWSSEKVSFKGRYWNLVDVGVDPKPVQKPSIPVWVGGRSDAAIARAARLADGWIAIFVTPSRFKEIREKLMSLARERGRDPHEITMAHSLFTSVGQSYEKARAVAAEYLSKNYNMPFEPLEKYVTVGTPSQCTERIKQFVEAGVNHIILRFTSTGTELIEQIQTYYEEIIPSIDKK